VARTREKSNAYRIYVSDIMPSKHNSLPTIIYLVIRLQCFDPLQGHHQAYIKNQKVYYILYFTCQTGSRVVYRVVHSLYRERRKKWRVECSNTQHILCCVCLKFLVEFGVRILWTFELWLLLMEL
jgi:hypothetical protein